MPASIAVIKDTIPHPHHGGSGVTVYSIIRELRARGMPVSVLALASSEHAGTYTQAELIEQFAGIGVPVQVLGNEDRPKGRRRWPTFRDQFPSLAQRPAVARWLAETPHNAVLAYHWDALGTIFGYRGCPRLGVVGDPVHLPGLFREMWNSQHPQPQKSWSKRLRAWLVGKRNVQMQINGMARLLNDCNKSGAFADHHAAELRGVGATQCQYYRTPVVDPLPETAPYPKSTVPKLLMIGHLRGIVTVAGVELLANEILPLMLDDFGVDGFEIHFVGAYFEQLPEFMRDKLNHKCVRVRGHINPPHEEFLSSHIVLVPTPIDLGIRVRIISAFSYGACVVAHVANREGIPELEDGVNCLLGGTGEALAKACQRVIQDPALRERLERGARHTFETQFSSTAAGGKIAEHLKELAFNHS